MRLIARIDVRNGYHIKTINCEGVEKIRPVEESTDIFSQGDNEHDEILLIDTVASLYGFDNWLIRQSNKHVYCPIPLAIGGGVSSVDIAISTLDRVADKIVINTAAVRSPQLLEKIANVCGRQAVILQIDTKKINDYYKCFTHGARELSNFSLTDWLSQAQDRGVGEVHVTSIDSEGIDEPFPNDLAELCRSNTQLPLIISGGIGTSEEMRNYHHQFEIDAFSFSSITNRFNIAVKEIRQQLLKFGEEVRCP